MKRLILLFSTLVVLLLATCAAPQSEEISPEDAGRVITVYKPAT